MNSLKILATEDTPEIIFDLENGVFKISNISLPENAVDFYMPVLDWLREYRNNALPTTVFEFNLEYLNTASSKQIFEIIFLIDTIHTEGGKDIKIIWHYDQLDEDMKSLGTRFASLIKVDFELMEYQSDDDDDFF